MNGDEKRRKSFVAFGILRFGHARSYTIAPSARENLGGISPD
jgi:hypothetical protein